MIRPERYHPPNQPVPVLALFIMLTDGGTHTGILHRIGGNLFIQDMMWHEMFRSAPCRDTYHFVEPSLEDEEVNDVTAMCRLIHYRHNSGDPSDRYRIPYAFRLGNTTRINNQNGEMMLGDGLGLTCSTFVLAVFESVRVPLVDFNGWQRRDDDDRRHAKLLDDMRNGVLKHNIPPAPPEHVAAVEAQLPCIRVRPEEVAGAGMIEELPGAFEETAQAGTLLLGLISPPA